MRYYDDFGREITKEQATPIPARWLVQYKTSYGWRNRQKAWVTKDEALAAMEEERQSLPYTTFRVKREQVR